MLFYFLFRALRGLSLLAVHVMPMPRARTCVVPSPSVLQISDLYARIALQGQVGHQIYDLFGTQVQIGASRARARQEREALVLAPFAIVSTARRCAITLGESITCNATRRDTYDDAGKAIARRRSRLNIHERAGAVGEKMSGTSNCMCCICKASYLRALLARRSSRATTEHQTYEFMHLHVMLFSCAYKSLIKMHALCSFLVRTNLRFVRRCN